MRQSFGEMVVIFQDNTLNSMQRRRRSVQNNWKFGALAIQFQEVTTIDLVHRKKSFQADDVNGFLRAGGGSRQQGKADGFLAEVQSRAAIVPRAGTMK